MIISFVYIIIESQIAGIIILLSDFFDVLGIDEDGGAAEHGEADDKGVGAVGVASYLALEAAQVAADYTDGVVDVEFGGSKVDGAVGLTEHEA